MDEAGMTNEAAERLRTFGTYVKSQYIQHDFRSDVDEALDTERQRVRTALEADLGIKVSGTFWNRMAAR